MYSFGSYLVACLGEAFFLLSLSPSLVNQTEILCFKFMYVCSGGERRVVELLEDESREPLLGAEEANERSKNKNKKKQKQKQSNPFWKFLCEPYVLGRELFVIEKFGLVQYVSHLPHLLLFNPKLLINSFELMKSFFFCLQDDPENLLCILDIFVGASWCLW